MIQLPTNDIRKGRAALIAFFKLIFFFLNPKKVKRISNKQAKINNGIFHENG